MKKLRVLAIHRYFWPDTPPYASILRKICSRWVEDGHDVEVLSTQPSYKADAENTKQAKDETVDGFKVHRMSLLPESGGGLFRALNAVLFVFRVFSYILSRRRYDVVMISTAPPVIGGLFACVAAKLIRAKFVYHCMDVHPEIGRISGEFRHPAIYTMLRWFDAWTCRNSNRVVVLSGDMGKAINSRPNSDGVAVSVINNFSLPDFDDVARNDLPSLLKTKGKFRVIFAGNLGRFQGLEVFVDAMKSLANNQNIEFVFLGAGKAKESLQSRAAGLSNVMFIPHQPLSIAKHIISDADLCVVSLVPGVVRYAYPSKTMTYLQLGRPLLISVEMESALAKMVNEEAVGIVVEPGCSSGIASALATLARDHHAWSTMQVNAARCGADLFEEKSILDQWSTLLRDIGSGVSGYV